MSRIQKLRRWFTIDRLAILIQTCLLAAAIVALIFQYGQIKNLKQQQADSDRQHAEFRSEVSRIRSTMEKHATLNVAPRPSIVAPIGFVNMTSPQQLLHESELTIANFGQGNAYDLRGKAIFTRIGFLDKNMKLHRKRLDAKQNSLDFLGGITLAAADRALFSTFRLPEMKGAQVVEGRVELTCKDEYGKQLRFTQPFAVIVHTTARPPHAHLNFRTATLVNDDAPMR